MSEVTENHNVNYRTNWLKSVLSFRQLQKSCKHYIKSLVVVFTTSPAYNSLRNRLPAFLSQIATTRQGCWMFSHSLHHPTQLAWQYIPLRNTLNLYTYMEQLISCEHLRVSPTYSTIRNVFYNGKFRKKLMNQKSLLNLKSNENNGTLSKKAQSKIALRINWLHAIAKNKRTFNPKYKSNYWWKLNMVTLTLPSKQNSADTLVKRKLLNTFLLNAKRKWKLQHYVWRAEPQLNGNIHFHLITDVFIPWLELRTEWNQLCSFYGYNSVTVNGNQANSVDIHSLNKVKNVIAYAIKYLAVNDKSARKIHGKLWNCSKSLSVLNGIDIPMDYDLHQRIWEMKENKLIKIYPYEWVSLIQNSMVTLANECEFIGKKIKEYIAFQWNSLREQKQKIITNTKITWKQSQELLNGLYSTKNSSQLQLDF